MHVIGLVSLPSSPTRYLRTGARAFFLRTGNSAVMKPNHPNARFHFQNKTALANYLTGLLFFISCILRTIVIFCCSSKPPSHPSLFLSSQAGLLPSCSRDFVVGQAKVAAATDEGHAALFAHAFSLCQPPPQTGRSFASPSNFGHLGRRDGRVHSPPGGHHFYRQSL